MDVDVGGAPPAVAQHKIAGLGFGKYTLLCKLATGGMGELFVARQTGAGGFEKLVVIKRLLPHLAEDAHFVAMLLDEARIAARLSHPNVCQVYDLGQADGHYYIAMEHLEGVPASLVLRRARRAGQRLDVGLGAAILRQAAEGLHHAHELTDVDGNSVGLVHRDVSPSNLFVTHSGVVKVLDFGVAKSQDALARTHTGALKGKYAYMSPEQVVGQPIDRRSDVWSLGIVLFELLTAQRLFWRDSEYKMFQAIVEEPIPALTDVRPGLPPRVAQVAERALSRNPDERFPSAREMAEALDDAMNASGALWRSSQIADYLSEHFGTTISERRQDVQEGALEAGRRARGRRAAGSVDGELDTEADAIVIDLTQADEPRAAPRSRGLLILAGLAIAGGVAAMGLSGLRQWWSYPDSAGPPVVVLDGEVETSDGRVTRAATAPSAAPARADGGPAEVESGPAPVPAEAGDGGRREPGDPFSQRLNRQQPAIRRCFNENATTIAGAPELSLALEIDRDGAVTSASLVPSALETTPLGECLLGIARTVAFGRQREEVRVTIPLKVRRR